VLSSDKARNLSRHVTEPAGQALARAGVTANGLTLLGLAGSLAAGVLIASGHPRTGGAVSLLSGLPDMLDGAVAKASGRVGRRGAFLDSVADRVSDAAVLTGIVWLAVGYDQLRLAVLASMVLSLSLIISYVKARAESLGFDCNVGIAERPERVIVLGFALLLGHPLAGLWVLAVATAVTVVQRVATVWQQAADAGR
jgi:CDP-diacylglycerol--glycerol-3-phosphate 3-phosphatidyltransferase